MSRAILNVNRSTVLLNANCHCVRRTALLFRFPSEGYDGQAQGSVLLRACCRGDDGLRALHHVGHRRQGSQFVLLSLAVHVHRRHRILRVVDGVNFVRPSLFLTSDRRNLRAARGLLRIFLTDRIVNVLTQRSVLTSSALPSSNVARFVSVRNVQAISRQESRRTRVLRFHLHALISVRSMVFCVACRLPRARLILVNAANGLHRNDDASTADQVVSSALRDLLVIEINGGTRVNSSVLSFLALVRARSAVGAV